MVNKKYSIRQIYNAFKKYKASKGKKVDFEVFKTTYLYKYLNR